jgi:RNA recognition motif-containing protein
MNIYVGNLSPEVTENDLRELFIKYGDLKSVSLVIDRGTGKSRGFAFIEMSDEAAQVAIEATNDSVLKGQALSVSQGRDRASSKPSLSRSGAFGNRKKGGRGPGGGQKRGGGRSNRGQNGRGGY